MMNHELHLIETRVVVPVGPDSTILGLGALLSQRLKPHVTQVPSIVLTEPLPDGYGFVTVIVDMVIAADTCEGAANYADEVVRKAGFGLEDDLDAILADRAARKVVPAWRRR